MRELLREARSGSGLSASSSVFVLISLGLVISLTNLFAASYRVVDLGTLQYSASDFSTARAINNFGQIVGYSSSFFDTYYWDAEAFFCDRGIYPPGYMTGLGVLSGFRTSRALAINNKGEIAGDLINGPVLYASGPYRAFVYRNHKMTNLGAFGGSGSTATGINDYGEIVGQWYGGPIVGFRFGAYDLDYFAVPPPTGGGTASYPYAINNTGIIAGRGEGNSSCQERPFVFNGTSTEILNIGPACDITGTAYAVNSVGDVVGNTYSTATGTAGPAFLWKQGNVTSLGTLPNGTYSIAYGINAADQVVGSFSTIDNAGNNVTHPFLWDNGNGRMQDLNDLIDPTSGWQLVNAWGINDHGQIVGDGIGPNGNHAFLLNPIISGFDVSRNSGEPSKDDFEVFRRRAGERLVIAAGWQGIGRNGHASTQLNNARRAGLFTAGYCYLNFAGPIDGGCQVKEALAAFGDEAKYLGFLAIDVEVDVRVPPVVPLPPCLQAGDANCQAQAIQRIYEAVMQTLAVGLRPIIYTHRSSWITITGGPKGTELFKDLPLWWAQDGVGTLDFTSGFWFGGWTSIVGKQWVREVIPTSFELDYDVFDFGAICLRNNYEPPTPCPMCSVQPQGSGFIISFDDRKLVLQEAPTMGGPWTPVTGATSPLTIAPINPQGFYRTVPMSKQIPGTWMVTSSMVAGRYAGAAALLPTGNVLFAGGDLLGDTAELYDPYHGSWTNTASMRTNWAYFTATALADGKVLIAGGEDDNDLTVNTETYDPDAGSWSNTGQMSNARYGHTATLLPTGKVLITGGQNSNVLSSAELFDPSTGTWTNTASMITARMDHTATLLPNGKVLVTGGGNSTNSNLASTEIYDPGTETWSSAASMGAGRFGHQAVLLSNNNVLVVGGWTANGNGASAEVYNLVNHTWTNTGSMTASRTDFALLTLPNEKVLAVGGNSPSGSTLSSAELFDPTSGSWSATGSLNAARASPRVTLLGNGNVLVAGGINWDTVTRLSSAELYCPSP